MKRRIDWIDICKGIGIFTMICGHIGLPYIADKYIHAWHMPIFFILSGYLFKEYELTDLVKRKTRSLLIPYFSFGIILYILSFLRNLIKHDTNMIKQLVDLFTFNTIGDLPFGNAIWFLTCIFFVEIMFSILKKCSKNKNILSIYILIVCISGYILSNLGIRLIWGIDSAMMAIGFYYIGYIVKIYRDKKYISLIFNPKLFNILILFILSTVGIFVNGYVNIRTIQYGNIIMFYINAILASLMIIMATIYLCNINMLKIIKSLCIFVGQNSLVYLAFNQLIIYISKNIFELFINNSIIISGITLILTLIVLSVMSLIINNNFYFLLGRFNDKKINAIVG